MPRSRYDEHRERIELEQARAEHAGLAFALIELPVTRIGDAPAVAALEAACAAQLRRCDVWGRTSEERFAIGLPFADEAEALRVWVRLWAGRGPAPTPELRVAKARVALPRPDAAEAADDDAIGPEVEIHPRGVLALVATPLPRWKRACDVVGAAAGLVVLAPVMALIALAIKLTSRGPVLFVHHRTGLGLERFPLLKFRTMVPGASKQQADLGTINEMSGPLFKAKSDPRLTPIGRFLRNASLDELPQLLNVLRGEMSLIGPRALSPLPKEFAPWHLERFRVVPGLACSWQAYHRAETDFDAWMRSDIGYVRRPESAWQDLRLLLRVVWTVLRREGAR